VNKALLAGGKANGTDLCVVKKTGKLWEDDLRQRVGWKGRGSRCSLRKCRSEKKEGRNEAEAKPNQPRGAERWQEEKTPALLSQRGSHIFEAIGRATELEFTASRGAPDLIKAEPGLRNGKKNSTENRAVRESK